MESEWRRGIPDWGFAFARVSLIAQLVVPIGIRNGIALFTNGSLRFVTLALVAGQVPVVGGPAPILNPLVGFPFGYNVFPD